MDLPILADVSASALVSAPLDSIDLTEWVFTLTDAEYQACAKGHIAAAATLAADGKRMSINVEHVGRLLIQHYVEAISERQHCRLVSLTDAIGPSIEDRSQQQVMWEFFAERVDENTTRFSNHVQVKPVPGFEQQLTARGITLEQLQVRMHKIVDEHNSEETPLFASDIERKALEGRWSA